MTKTLDVSIVLGPPPSRKSPIKLEQLNELAKSRSDVSIREIDTGTRAKRDIVIVDPSGSVPGELLFIDGRLQIRDPSEATLKWMLSLAKDLNGRVIDNTLKTYRSFDETYVHPDDEDGRRRLAAAIRDARKIDQARPMRKRRWFGLWASILAVGVNVSTSAPSLQTDRPSGPSQLAKQWPSI